MLNLIRTLRGIRSASPQQAAVSMIGARPGDTVLFCGASRPEIAGGVGAITGLNGQTTVVDRRAGADTQVAAAAAAAGALVDFEDAPLTLLPFDTGHWDAAVIVDGLRTLEGEAAQVLSEAIRVVRPGGRVVLLDRVSRPGLFGLVRAAEASAEPAEKVVSTLGAAGLRAARLLAEVEGVRYFEAVKGRTE
ncbi:MAG: methyltransferase domain-containing protein [Acidobacteria bacterium]|nr:methyltransferase domain-containing protein [Acidobacteriota bacterium]